MLEKVFKYDGVIYKAVYQVSIDILTVYRDRGDECDIYRQQGHGSMDKALIAFIRSLD